MGKNSLICNFIIYSGAHLTLGKGGPTLLGATNLVGDSFYKNKLYFRLGPGLLVK